MNESNISLTKKIFSKGIFCLRFSGLTTFVLRRQNGIVVCSFTMSVSKTNSLFETISG